jgi:hypothetical protein
VAVEHGEHAALRELLLDRGDAIEVGRVERPMVGSRPRQNQASRTASNPSAAKRSASAFVNPFGSVASSGG